MISRFLSDSQSVQRGKMVHTHVGISSTRDSMTIIRMAETNDFDDGHGSESSRWTYIICLYRNRSGWVVWGLVDSVRYLYARRKRVDNCFQEGKYVSNNTMGCHRSATSRGPTTRTTPFCRSS